VFLRRFAAQARKKLREVFEEKLDAAAAVISVEGMMTIPASLLRVAEGFIFATHLAANGIAVPEIISRYLCGCEGLAPDWHIPILQEKST
jgi:hypothetical protein